MKPLGDDRLPPTVGGLIDFAFAVYGERALLYAGLAGLLFALCAALEFLWPANGNAVARSIASPFLDIFLQALVIAAVALGIGTRVGTGDTAPARALLDGALGRWLPVVGAMMIVQFIVVWTLQAGAIGPIDDPVLTVFSAPVTWLLWGAMGLAGPCAALNGDRPALAILTGFGRALMLGLRAVNLPRLCIVAFATVMPMLLQTVLFDVLQRRGIGHADFWANVPIDALIVGPLAALQTVFALDFARRTGRIEGAR